MKVKIEGQVVAARRGRDNQDGTPSKYADLKVLNGESLVNLWGFLDSLQEAHGSLPEVGTQIVVTGYVQAKEPKRGGQPYLSTKAVAWESAAAERSAGFTLADTA